MSLSKQVDLDALEKLRAAATQGEWLIDGSLVYTLVHDGWRKGVEEFRNRGMVRCEVQRYPEESDQDAQRQALTNAEFLQAILNQQEALIAELRAARELLGLVTGLQIGSCHVYAADSMNSSGRWAVEDDSDENQTEYFSGFHEALAAAREWEARQS